jgi:transcriptional regulator with GAF, ATPase, and Fis domain
VASNPGIVASRLIDLPLAKPRPVWLHDAGIPTEVVRLRRLAAEYSAALLRLDPTAAMEVETAITGALWKIGDALDADRIALLELRSDSVEHVWTWSRSGQGLHEEDGAATPVAWATEVLTSGQPVVCGTAADLAARVGAHAATGVRSALVVPVTLSIGRLWAVAAADSRLGRVWSATVIDQVRLVGEILVTALHRGRLAQILAGALRSTRRIDVSATPEPREDVDEFQGLGQIIGHSLTLKDPLDRLRQVADTHTSVLLLGETGTGKELFAKAIHARSRRRERPLVLVNCAALPATLIDSELFGHERGAFTGATACRQGRFELADRGTIFLDELGDLPPDVQVKLLRVLQEHEFERVGSSQMRKVNVRLIAATHHDLKALVAAGRFRADLVWHFIHRRQRALHREITDVPADVMTRLMKYRWPGNVRELQNVVERALIRSSGRTLVLDEWPNTSAMSDSDTTPVASLENVERSHIVAILERCSWRINGAGNAAVQLGLHPNTLRFRMKKLAITRPASRSVA